MTSEAELNALSKFIDDQNGIFTSTIPVELEDLGDDLFEVVDTVDKCPHCGADILGPVTQPDGSEIASCQGECGKITYPENERYKLDLTAIFQVFCDRLGYDMTEGDVDTAPMPLYARVHLTDTLRLNLICNTDKLEESVEKLFGDAVRNSRVNAILAPKSILEDIYEFADQYPVASFAPSFSIKMLDDPTTIVETIESAVAQRARSDTVISRTDLKDKALAETIENNPGAIRTELTYARVRRDSSLDASSLGSYFENVCQASLMTLDIATKPLGTSGENVADIAFKFPQNDDRIHGEPILGVVDAKSASETLLSSEKIADKHRDYIWQANTQPFTDGHVAHVFVVFDMEGLEANEIDWYRLIRDEYREAGVDGTMVVLYADALAQMVHIAQSPLQRDELNVETDGLHEVFRPFFNSSEFHHEVSDEIRLTTRVDQNDSATENYPDRDSYRNRYKECEDLIVVLPEMVVQRYQNVISSEEKSGDGVFLDLYPDYDY